MAKVKKGYLVIWQLGDDVQSKTKTPIRVEFDLEFDFIQGMYDKILKELEQATGYKRRVINILGLYNII